MAFLIASIFNKALLFSDNDQVRVKPQSRGGKLSDSIFYKTDYMTAMSSISAGHGSSFLEYQDLETVKGAWILPEFVRFCLRLEIMIQYNVIIY